MHKHPILTETRIFQALPRLEALIYSPSEPVEIAAWDVHGEPVPFSHAQAQEFTPCKVGDPWGAQWDTVWFRVRGTVPPAWKGEEVVVRLRLTNDAREGFTAEGLVYQEGRVGVAINANRREVSVAQSAKGGETFEFYVEAAANGGTSELGSGKKLGLADYYGAPMFRLEQAEMAVVNREAFALYYDFKVGCEAMQALPENSQRRGELRYALNEALNLWDKQDPATLSAARQALQPVLARRNGEGGHEVSAVGHAHIDTAWLWPLRETIRKCARTFSTALDYMERYPEYVFVCSQAQQYAWMKEYYPEIWSRIQAAVKRGQWEPVGSMWVEVDCNLASGESLVRQILKGKQFFKQELGYETRDAWIPDVFGYAASMPQIFRKTGIDYFLTQKISWNQFNKFPHHTFEWEGIDGSRIFSHFPPADTYNADTGPKQLLHSVNNFKDHDRAKHSLLPYGWGDGGGGPSIEMLEKARRVADFEGLPKVKSETVLAFFERARREAKDLPVWVGELYLEFHRGTYTAQAKNKLGNRKSELLLRDAEFFDAVTSVLAPDRVEAAADPERAVYDVTGLHDQEPTSHRAALDRAWKLVLLNQFHDIIPGSSIHWVYQDSARDYATIEVLGRSVRESAFSALASRIDTSGFAKPICIYNTLGLERSEVVTLPDGTQRLATVPPCGYTLIEGAKPPVAAPAVRASADADGILLENESVRVRIDPRGHLSSVYDVRAGREVLAGPANAFQLHEDIPNCFDAWDLDIFYKERMQAIEGLESMTLAESTPLSATVEIVRSFGQSRIQQRIVLRAGSPRIDFQTKVHWQESQKILKVAFPVNIRSMSAKYEIQYGYVERPTHLNTSWDMARFEVCAQKWADLSEPGYGVALLNDCKYGHEITGNVMRLSLLTASIAPDPVADRGDHAFTYSLLPHSGDFIQGRVKEEADALNAPLRLVEMAPQRGELPAAHSFFSVDRAGVVIEAVKVAEEGKAIIVRLHEAHGARGAVRLSVGLPFREVAMADLLEREERPIQAKGGVIELEVVPFEIVTLRFNL